MDVGDLITGALILIGVCFAVHLIWIIIMLASGKSFKEIAEYYEERELEHLRRRLRWKLGKSWISLKKS